MQSSSFFLLKRKAGVHFQEREIFPTAEIKLWTLGKKKKKKNLVWKVATKRNWSPLVLSLNVSVVP